MYNINSFEELKNIMLRPCGTIDTPLFIKALKNANIDIMDIIFDERTGDIIIKQMTFEQQEALKCELLISQKESDKVPTDRVFCLEEMGNRFVVPTNKYKPHVIERSMLMLKKMREDLQSMRAEISASYNEIATDCNSTGLDKKASAMINSIDRILTVRKLKK